MARISIQTLFLTLLLWCLLAEKGFCKPNDKEDSYEDYQNDDDDYDDDKDDDAYEGPPPEIKSKSLTLEVHPGEKVVLPCETINLTQMQTAFTVLWKKDKSLLYMDELQQGAKDLRIVYNKSNNALVISNVNASDSGLYCCSFSSSPEVEVVHSLNVFAPASIRGIDPPGLVAVLHKGIPATLRCNVTGYPRPEVIWKKFGKHDMPESMVVSNSEVVTFNAVKRNDSGTYQCTAKNNQGPAVATNLTVRVHYLPEIHVEEELVTSATDYDAVLLCVVHADPKARVYWYKNNVPVDNPENHTKIYNEGNKYYYQFLKTQVNDFGKYTCHASNSLGTSRKEIEFTGKPSTPHFVGARQGDDGRSLELEWDVTSYLPLIEYKLLYKDTKKSDAKWQIHKPPVNDGEEGNVFKLKYELKDLPTGEFMVTLRAKNDFGWSNQAKQHYFTIKGKVGGGSTRPRITAILTIISLSAFFL